MIWFARQLLNLDRRFIFLLVAACTLIPLIVNLSMPTKISDSVLAVYKALDALPPGSKVLISMDFDPSSKAELEPMAEAVIYHLLSKQVKVVGMTLWGTGKGLAEKILDKVARELGREDGKDYVMLGFKTGGLGVIGGMGEDLYKTFTRDSKNRETRGLPVLSGINSLRDFDYVVCIAAGDPGIETWIVYGKEKYKFKMCGGCTAVIATGLYIYYQTGQISGLIGGMKGAAEYEQLIKRRGTAAAGMMAQSLVHFLIIALVILCNILYFLTRKRAV